MAINSIIRIYLLIFKTSAFPRQVNSLSSDERLEPFIKLCIAYLTKSLSGDAFLSRRSIAFFLSPLFQISKDSTRSFFLVFNPLSCSHLVPISVNEIMDRTPRIAIIGPPVPSAENKFPSLLISLKLR